MAAARNYDHENFERWRGVSGHCAWVADQPRYTQFYVHYESDEVRVHTYSRGYTELDDYITLREVSPLVVEVARQVLRARSWSSLRWFVSEFLRERGFVQGHENIIQVLNDNDEALWPLREDKMHLMFHYAPRTIEPGGGYGAIYWETIRGYRLSIHWRKPKDGEGELWLDWTKIGSNTERWRVLLNTESGVTLGFSILERPQLFTLKVLCIDHLWLELDQQLPDTLMRELEKIK